MHQNQMIVDWENWIDFLILLMLQLRIQLIFFLLVILFWESENLVVVFARLEIVSNKIFVYIASSLGLRTIYFAFLSSFF